jgi:hypothetical protein
MVSSKKFRHPVTTQCRLGDYHPNPEVSTEFEEMYVFLY